MIPNLEPGTVVKAREISTVEGFILDGTPQDIQIRDSDAHELTFRNQRQGNLVVRKLDKETRQPLPGVEFRIVYADGRPVDNANGNVSSNGQFFTNANGEIVIHNRRDRNRDCHGRTDNPRLCHGSG